MNRLISASRGLTRLFVFCVAFGGVIPASIASGSGLPNEPIHLLVGTNPGNSTDLTARALAEDIGALLNRRVVVSNRSAGSGTSALISLQNSKPDGTQLGVVGSTAIRNQYIQATSYRVGRDFTAIARYMSFNFGLVVRADAPWKTLKEFVDHAKANPGKLNYGVSHLGSPQHLTMVKLGLAEGIDWTPVAFGGGAQAVTALLGGHVNAVSQTSDWVPHVDSGAFRLLATFDKERMARYPNVPTLRDLGYDIDEPGFNSLIGPKGMPEDVVKLIGNAVKKAVENRDSAFNQVMRRFELPVDFMGPEEFSEYLVRFEKASEEIIRQVGLINEKLR